MGLQICENLSSISHFLVTIPQVRQAPGPAYSRRLLLQLPIARLYLSDAHLTISRRNSMNKSGYDDIGPHYDVIVTSNQVCPRLYRKDRTKLVVFSVIAVNPMTGR